MRIFIIAIAFISISTTAEAKDYFILPNGLRAIDFFSQKAIDNANAKIEGVAKQGKDPYNIAISIETGLVDPFFDEKKEKTKLEEKGLKTAQSNFKKYKVEKSVKGNSVLIHPAGARLQRVSTTRA